MSHIIFWNPPKWITGQFQKSFIKALLKIIDGPFKLPLWSVCVCVLWDAHTRPKFFTPGANFRDRPFWGSDQFDGRDIFETWWSLDCGLFKPFVQIHHFDSNDELSNLLLKRVNVERDWLCKKQASGRCYKYSCKVAYCPYGHHRFTNVVSMDSND